MRNCAASAPHATRKADARRLGNVHSADSAEPPAVDRKASSFSLTCAEDSPAPEGQQATWHCKPTAETTWTTMGRDQMKSTTPLPAAPGTGTSAPAPFEMLVREILAQLGEDPAREG